MKILTMSVFCVDIFESSKAIQVGGNSLNFAVQCKKSGADRISVLGCVGDDYYGTLVKKYLSKFDFDKTRLYTRAGRTASNRIYTDDRGDRYFLPDSWDGGLYETFRLSDDDWEFVRAHDIVHMTANDPNFTAALKRITPNNKLSADFLDSRDLDFIEKALPGLDICFISGNEEVVGLLTPLSEKYGKLILVTLGAKGSTAILNGKRLTLPAVPVDSVVDTTGCGDAYQAAFTVSWYKEGNLQKAMVAGSLAASKVLTHIGGVEDNILHPAPGSVEIRELCTESELAESAPIIREAFLTVAHDMGLTEENCPSNPAFITDEKVKEIRVKGLKPFGLFCNGSQAGFAAVEKADSQVYYLERLAVLPGYRHNGLGRKLMDFVFDYVRNQDGVKISIAIINENTVLKKWYSDYGFNETAVKQFKNLPFTVCFMEKQVQVQQS